MLSCPKCTSNAEVIDSRSPKRSVDVNMKFRRLECLKCHYRFNSIEVPIHNDVQLSQITSECLLALANHISTVLITSVIDCTLVTKAELEFAIEAAKEQGRTEAAYNVRKITKELSRILGNLHS